MQMIQGFRGQDVWVRKVEHIVLRVVSLGFSLASAHAIRWFFAPLDDIDRLQPIITWMVVIQRATWLQVIPANQRAVLTAFTYLVLSIIPLVSLLLAVVDMDLERSKHTGVGGVGGVPIGSGIGSPFLNGNRGPVYGPPVMQPMRMQAQANPHAQPKDVSLAGIGGYPLYSQGYSGNGSTSTVVAPGGGSQQQPAVSQQSGGILSNIPFLSKRQAQVPPPTTVLPSTP